MKSLAKFSCLQGMLSTLMNMKISCFQFLFPFLFLTPLVGLAFYMKSWSKVCIHVSQCMCVHVCSNDFDFFPLKGAVSASCLVTATNSSYHNLRKRVNFGTQSKGTAHGGGEGWWEELEIMIKSQGMVNEGAQSFLFSPEPQ